MEHLQAVLGQTGSIIVYNAAFEKGVLSRCAQLLPEFQPWVASVKRRVVDLLIPFRSFNVYHPAQRGSTSIKAVMPVLTGRGYDELEIQQGNAASQEYLRVTFGEVPILKAWSGLSRGCVERCETERRFDGIPVVTLQSAMSR